jgi:hypothetical protein
MWTVRIPGQKGRKDPDYLAHRSKKKMVSLHPHWLQTPLVSASHLSESFLLMWKVRIHGGLNFCISNSHFNWSLPIGIHSEKVLVRNLQTVLWTNRKTQRV